MVLEKLPYLASQHEGFTGLLITIREEQDDSLDRVKSQRITRFRTSSLGVLVIPT